MTEIQCRVSCTHTLTFLKQCLRALKRRVRDRHCPGTSEDGRNHSVKGARCKHQWSTSLVLAQHRRTLEPQVVQLTHSTDEWTPHLLGEGAIYIVQGMDPDIAQNNLWQIKSIYKGGPRYLLCLLQRLDLVSLFLLLSL